MDRRTRTQILAQLVREHQESHGVFEGTPRSLFIRHLDCGSCNACELELNALTNPIYDIGRWGIRFEASPRHADVLVLTGPYVRGLDKAARATLEAMPVPRVIRIGNCAVQNTPFEKAYGTSPLPSEVEKATIFCILGCPPTPLQILEALLRIEAFKESPLVLCQASIDG